MSRHGPEPAQYHLRILRCLARYLEERVGPEALAEACDAAAIAPEDFESAATWISLRQMEAFFTSARRHLPDDAAFKAACAYEIVEAYGPMFLLRWAMTTAGAFKQAEPAGKLLTTVGHFHAEEAGATRAIMRYTSSVPESRNMCLARQGQSVTVPRYWGLPDAKLREGGCIAFGDPACEYHVEWEREPRSGLARKLVTSLVPAAIVGAGGYFVAGPMVAAGLALVSALLALCLEIRRERDLAQNEARILGDALYQSSHETLEAVQHLREARERAEEWARRSEAARDDLARVLSDFGTEVRGENPLVRGVSHDMKTPLMALRLVHRTLRNAKSLEGDAREAIDDLDEAIARLDRLVESLLEANASALRVQPETVSIADYAASLRRRLGVLVLGKSVRASVTLRDGTPPEITTDRGMLDRIVDNLVANAIESTAQGTVAIELEGSADSLVLRVVDTGLGLDPAAVPALFVPGARARPGRGFGLANVLLLTRRLEGRIVVRTAAGAGSAFELELPVKTGGGSASELLSVEPLARADSS
jgi:signal transduction histidine kinase